MRYSLFFFAAGDTSAAEPPYQLVLDCARWADETGLEAIWLPERHLHPFGGRYPAPAVLAAAVAGQTSRLGLRAGSVVAPLDHPLRIAEQWAVVDQLSGGRVGISFASGWHREDFLLADEPYAERGRVSAQRMAQTRALWRGETVEFGVLGAEPVAARLHPAPVQPELPTWVTTGGSAATAAAAGQVGAHLLTHLVGQGFPELAAVVEAYRAAYRRAPGGPPAGTVTLMLHTHLCPTTEQAIAEARPGLVRYLREAADLQLRSLARARLGIDPDELTEEDLEAIAEHAAAGYLERTTLIGAPDDAAAVVERAAACGVDEIACLVDFVEDPDLVRAALPQLARLCTPR